MEKTFVMIKPDGVERGLIGEIISRFERKGIEIYAAEIIVPTEDTVRKHYQEHSEKPFFNDLVSSIKDRRVLAMVLEGENVIKLVRAMVGDKDPLCSIPGTIRGDFAIEKTRNLVHASDSPESAAKEIDIWFGEKII